MRHLYLRIYLAIVLILIVFGILAAGLWWWLPERTERHQTFYQGLGAIVQRLLPAEPSPRTQREEALMAFHRTLPGRYTLLDGENRVLAHIGPPLAPPGDTDRSNGWQHIHGGPVWSLSLPDDRLLLARPQHPQHRGWRFLLALTILGGLLALLVLPLARGLTGRLERLQRRVDGLARGDLESRVVVEGRDEVAALATSFNTAADRIRTLLTAHKELLTTVSHELRTPLTRLRMGIELLKEEPRPELRTRMIEDVNELDRLIGELLLASRLDHLDRNEPVNDGMDEVDLLALLAEEAAPLEIEVGGEPALLRGEPRWLRRMIRNLLVNAQRHGDNREIICSVRTTAEGAELTVADRGPGIGAEEAERIFEPFYQSQGQQSGQGIGLGLALVRRIARRHGGEATCAPREGGGTRFTITLPRNPPAQAIDS